MPNQTASFIKTFQVDSNWFMTDELNRLNFTKMLEAILKTSFEHDQSMQMEQGQELLKKNESWVITQNLCHVFKNPRRGDEIQVETKIISANRFFLERLFEVRTDKNKLLECQIQFAVINLISRKMGRINSKRLDQMQLIDQSESVKKRKITLNSQAKFIQEDIQVINDQDIDFNDHVNNLVYINWAISHLPNWIPSQYSIQHLSIKYGHELLRDDQVSIKTYSEFGLEEIKTKKDLTTFQVIYNDLKEQEAARLEIQWLKTEG